MTDDGEQVRKYRERADELRAMVHGMKGPEAVHEVVRAIMSGPTRTQSPT